MCAWRPFATEFPFEATVLLDRNLARTIQQRGLAYAPEHIRLRESYCFVGYLLAANCLRPNLVFDDSLFRIESDCCRELQCLLLIINLQSI